MCRPYPGCASLSITCVPTLSVALLWPYIVALFKSVTPTPGEGVSERVGFIRAYGSVRNLIATVEGRPFKSLP
jgi:hypothetical protein